MSIKDLKKIASKYVVRGPKLNEIAYELFFSKDETEEDLEQVAKYGNKIRESILSLRRLEAARTRILEKYDLSVRSTTVMEGNVKCPYCQSTNTTYSLRQTRSADEAPTLILFCESCGRRSTNGG